MSKYIEWIPRVSNIVDTLFPFWGEDEKRFHQWLKTKKIDVDEYMSTATSWWTEVHEIMEKCVKWRKFKIPIHLSDEANAWIRLINNLKQHFPNAKFITEMYVRDTHWRWQWTIDLVILDWNNAYMFDWKTYEISKKKWELPQKLNKNGSPPKPTAKIKKVEIQLNLYAECLKQMWFEIRQLNMVWLHSAWYFMYEIDSIDTSNIYIEYLKLITNMNKEIILEIKSPLKIKLQTPPISYAAISVELDLKDVPYEERVEAVNEAVRVQKSLHNSYINLWA